MDQPPTFQAAVDALLALSPDDQRAHLQAAFPSDRDGTPRLELRWRRRHHEEADAQQSASGSVTTGPLAARPSR